MNPRLLAIGKPPRMEILDCVKRSMGLGVQEISQALSLGAAGIKQHCDALCEEGYLDTGRRSKPLGRPEIIYRLTPKAHRLFPQVNQSMTLDVLRHAAHLYGPTAPEKLLFGWFEDQRRFYLSRVKGTGLELRLKSLARLREEEGCMPDVVPDPWRLVEYHSPTLELRSLYPMLTRFETNLVSEAIGIPVRREEETVTGVYRSTFFPEI